MRVVSVPGWHFPHMWVTGLPHITLSGHLQYKLPDFTGIVSNFETSDRSSDLEDEKNASAFFEFRVAISP
jgi:hypothetical protein